jgi:hypothetical protein
MKVLMPEGKETLEDDEAKEAAQSGGDCAEAA